MKTLLGTLLALSVPALAAPKPPPVPQTGIGSSASLTGLRYEVIDLNPQDGIRPEVQFSGGARARAWARADFCARYSGCVVDLGSFTEPAFATTGGSRADSFGAVTPAGLFAGGHYEITDIYRSNQNEYSGTARLRGTEGQPLFMLAPHTAVRVTAQYTLDAWSIPFPSRYRLYPYLTGQADASVFFESRSIEGPAPRVSIQTQVTAPDFAPSFEHLTGEISAVFRNDLDRSARVWGRLAVDAGGIVPGIPEPSTPALLLVGLGVVGAAGWRHRARMRTKPA